ncbi:hypothetical protein DCC85_10075 [Paenibacillus sp. CAA11]|uniref:hypothetical protein n=1 Tax=Paenibacillus sp. CAA11 TaxID=1532905 RepID=UPI000D34CF93|nr:hypothetical protein [Paenibacillus sp. CAA11]AWB44539.1 hypothetical protein DCC85_10075 [Paenibacillus sp. CAA11]
MKKLRVYWRAAYLQLRIYLWCIVGAVLAAFAVNAIISLFVDNSENIQVSAGNELLIFLIFMSIILPVSFFRRYMNLGASRQDYYRGVIVTIVVWAAIMSILNLLYYKLEVGYIREYIKSFNIIEVFHWDEKGIAGILLYQFGAYLLLMSLLNLLFSGIKSVWGWVIWILLIAGITVGTSVPALRGSVADFFLALLFNDSLAAGLGLTTLLSAVCFAGGYMFIRRRTV